MNIVVLLIAWECAKMSKSGRSKFLKFYRKLCIVIIQRFPKKRYFRYCTAKSSPKKNRTRTFCLDGLDLQLDLLRMKKRAVVGDENRQEC